jgi:hypothetical protein
MGKRVPFDHPSSTHQHPRGTKEMFVSEVLGGFTWMTHAAWLHLSGFQAGYINGTQTSEMEIAAGNFTWLWKFTVFTR